MFAPVHRRVKFQETALTWPQRNILRLGPACKVHELFVSESQVENHIALTEL